MKPSPNKIWVIIWQWHWFKLERLMGHLKSLVKVDNIWGSPVTSLCCVWYFVYLHVWLLVFGEWGSAPVSFLRLTHLPDQSCPLLRHCIAHTLLNHVAETRICLCLVFCITYTASTFLSAFCILEGSFCLGSSEVNGCAFYWPSNFCSLVTASSWL